MSWFLRTTGTIAPAANQVSQITGDLNNFYSNDFRLANFEMETAGYYALGRLLGHEVVSVNAILANRITNKFSKIRIR
ncbi:MAG: hypothetical protein WDN75_11580 [Bacteroidota bacterium]